MPTFKILAKHVKAAAKAWDRNPGFRGFRNGTTYEVVIGGKSYPPKAIASYANDFAGNEPPLFPQDFAGAWEGKWHKQLEDAGFKPQKKSALSGSAVPRSPQRPRRSTAMAEIDEKKTFAEGAQYYAEHIKRERNAKAVKAAKDHRWNHVGAFACDACSFDFSKTYGERGSGYIEAHHTIPVRSMRPGHQTKITDFALVCANCHRMLHRIKPLIGVAQLKALLAKGGTP